MAKFTLSVCSTEGSLEELGQAVINESNRVVDDILNQLNALDTTEADAGLDSANAMYDDAIFPNSNDDVASQLGLMGAQPSEEEEEARLEPFGLVLIKGILWCTGTDTNIENLRRLFFAVGSNVTLFLQLLNSTDEMISVQTRLLVKKLPTRQAKWTLAEARALFSNDAIESVYQAGDGWYAIVPQFLDYNKSVEKVALTLSVPKEEIVTQVFWLKEVKQNSTNINKLTKFGLSSDERTSVLTSKPIKTVRPAAIETLRVQAEQSIKTTLDQMKLLNSRWSRVSSTEKENYRKEILKSLGITKVILFQLQQKLRFYPILIKTPEDMNTFLELNTQQHIPYMFATRRTVQSIDFLATSEELAKRIRAANNIPAGSNTVSSVMANAPSLADLDLQATNAAMAQTECALVAMSKSGALQFLDLNTAFGCVSNIKLRPTQVVISNIPVIGYKSYESPASVMFRRVNFTKTLKIDNVFDKIIALAKPLTDIIYLAIKALVDMLKSLKKTIDKVIASILKKVKEITSKIESFLSRHGSYFATGSIDSSILKCALGLNLSVDLPFLKDLEPFLDELKKKLKNMLSEVAKTISDFVTKLTCIPMTFLNDLLKSITSFLPPICKTDTFKLPEDLQAAFAELQGLYAIENATYNGYSRSLLTIQAAINALPASVASFKEDIICNQTPQNSRFMAVFSATPGLSVGTNPLGSVAKLIPGRG